MECEIMNSSIYKIDNKTAGFGVVFNSWENDFNYHYEFKLSRIPGGWNGQMSKLKINNWIKALIQDLDKSIPNNSTVLRLAANDSNPYIADRFIEIRSKKPLDITTFKKHSKFNLIDSYELNPELTIEDVKNADLVIKLNN